VASPRVRSDIRWRKRAVNKLPVAFCGPPLNLDVRCLEPVLVPNLRFHLCVQASHATTFLTRLRPISCLPGR
jgi:hypothetical protein